MAEILNESFFETVINKLWNERNHLAKNTGATEDDKKNNREKLKNVTDDLHKFLELQAKYETDLRQQKLDLIELKKKKEKGKRLQHESDIDFVDTDETTY